ncbi:ABC transporter ATP-binding protein [uncultured Nocardioides sp.]|uniref:ABC transporter ATP-binding protein n=2 Tax=uncultured Nocardioides sp. TaxID=198441 RepID=UPI0026399C51|nr:ABC transporter ATP-binding protein [uncultured Nocardioides sp.]
MTAAPPTLELRGVEVSHGRRRVLHALSLDVRPGELLVVVGPSGSGKTTMLRAAAGLEPVDAGRVLLDGDDITDLPPGRRDLAMVFADLALLPHLDVAANIAFGELARGARRREVRGRVKEVAAAFGIADLLKRRVTRLSGGEQQRVALARAALRRPAAHLLDEPLSHLDPVLREEARSQVQVLRSRVGAPVVLVTHDPHEALAMADRVAVLREGRIVQVGTPEQVYETPADTFVARFVGPLPMNLLARDDGHVGIRPEHVRLGDDLDARVERVEHAGTEAVVHTVTERGPVVLRLPWGERPAVGDDVRLGWAPAHLHAFDRDGRRLAR